MARRIRRHVLDCSRAAGVGHIGSSLSIADLLAVLYGEVLANDAPGEEQRDRFVLSKGHAALALYAALVEAGRLEASELEAFCADGSILATHPEHAVEAIDFSTGSLGQGLSMGAGAALGSRLRGSAQRIYVLISDAECNEGSVWEAVMFAAHHRLANLVAIVDANGQQALGHTRDVMDISPIAERWRAFGWDTHEVDGHNTGALESILSSLDTESGPPHVLVADTTFGKGVSYMESRIAWHYWPMSDEQYGEAVEELERDARSVPSGAP
jgi:transketolase